NTTNNSHTMDNNQSIGLYVVLLTSIAFAIVNLVCTLYVMTRSLKRWLVTKTTLSTAHRVPLYIAISASATINFGGIGNMITYIINEKWRDDYKSKISGTSALFSPKIKFTANNTYQSQITIEEVVIVEVKQNPIPIPPIESVVGVVSVSKGI
ncbi:16540_t:CDS:2, partial [Cetraspora pellucida]